MSDAQQYLQKLKEIISSNTHMTYKQIKKFVEKKIIDNSKLAEFKPYIDIFLNNKLHNSNDLIELLV